MDGSGNHDGRRWQDCDGWRQQQLAITAQWATGRQSNCNGQWDSSGAMDGTMGRRRSPADDGTKMRAMLGIWSVGVL
jgi:hypothetical protein